MTSVPNIISCQYLTSLSRFSLMKYYFLLFCLIGFSFLHAQTDSSHFLTSFDKTKIYYEDKGLGYPVILIHGFSGTGQGWKRTQVYKALLEAGYRVIIPDLRGNGKSDKPHADEDYANNAEAKDIVSLASSLGIKSYSVVGYSRGSIIAASLLAIDKRVNKAVLGGMGTDFTNPEWTRRKMFYHVLNGDTTVAELEPLIKRIQSDTSLDRTALALQQKEQPSTPKKVLRAVNQPVMVICGSEDSDNGNAKALALLFKKGKYAEVPGDHGFAMSTKEFGENVIRFLGDSKPL